MKKEDKLKIIETTYIRRIPVLINMLKDGVLGEDEVRELMNYYKAKSKTEFKHMEGAEQYINEIISKLLDTFPENTKGMLPITIVDLNELDWMT